MIAVNQRIRKEQAGFRAGRGCSDQIFALRNIVEQCIEWIASLFDNFVEFKRDFDSIHRDTLWVVMRHYCLLVSCSMNDLNEDVSDFFGVQKRGLQRCMLSPLL